MIDDPYKKHAWEERNQVRYGRVTSIDKESDGRLLVRYRISSGQELETHVGPDSLLFGQVNDPHDQPLDIYINLENQEAHIVRATHDEFLQERLTEASKINPGSKDVEKPARSGYNAMSAVDAIRKMTGGTLDTDRESLAELLQQSELRNILDAGTTAFLGGAGPGNNVTVSRDGKAKVQAGGASQLFEEGQIHEDASHKRSNMTPDMYTRGMSKLPADEKFNHRPGPLFWPKYDMDLTELFQGVGVIGKVLSALGGL